MKIETKFNLGDTVFFFNTKELKIDSGEIKQINFLENISGARHFHCCIGKQYTNVYMDKIFSTREELVEFINRENCEKN